MLESFYNSLSGMLTQQRVLNTLSNNIVNSKTPGFKEERVTSSTFQDELTLRTENGKRFEIGKGNALRIVKDSISDLNASSLEETGRVFDVAIVGKGFFNIKGDGKQLMTRNGNFNIDDEGYLVLEGAGRVMGKKGEIKVSSSDFNVLNDGTVTSANGNVIDKLLITQPPEGTQLEKFTNGLYTTPQENNEVGEADFKTVQHSLETANYDINREYTLIMEAQRSFQACSSALKMLDNINQKTVSQIGSI